MTDVWTTGIPKSTGTRFDIERNAHVHSSPVHKVSRTDMTTSWYGEEGQASSEIPPSQHRETVRNGRRRRNRHRDCFVDDCARNRLGSFFSRKKFRTRALVLDVVQKNSSSEHEVAAFPTPTRGAREGESAPWRPLRTSSDSTLMHSNRPTPAEWTRRSRQSNLPSWSKWHEFGTERSPTFSKDLAAWRSRWVRRHFGEKMPLHVDAPARPSYRGGFLGTS